MHTCLQKNVSNEGVERAEVFLKSNRRTAQFVSVPAGHDYLWVDSQPQIVRELLTTAAGGNRNDVLLLGGGEMRWGFRGPFLDVSYDAHAYQNGFIGAVNQVGAMLGGVTEGDQLGVALAALECAVDSARHGAGGLDGCVLTLLADTDLLVAGLDEMLRGADMGIVERNQFLGKVRVPFDRIEPLAKGLVKGLLVTEAVTNAWDAIWDNLADGKLTSTSRASRGSVRPRRARNRLPRLPAPIR